MQRIQDVRGLNRIASGGSLTIGNFDGLHLGHRELIRALKKGPTPHTVLTFSPHPVKILKPEVEYQPLFRRDDLAEQLDILNVDALALLPFTLELSRLEAEKFLTDFVANGVRPRRMVLGYDFGLGRGRSLGSEGIANWAEKHGIEVLHVPPLTDEAGPVSSRRVREYLIQGDVTMANKLLGRSYYTMGFIESGAGRGRGLSAPTINLSGYETLLPRIGVYATRTHFLNQTLDSVSNVGVNPTFETDGRVRLETHILDVNLGEFRPLDPIRVEYLGRIRDEQKFSSQQDLKNQIQRDILKAKEILKGQDEAMDRDQPNS